MDLWKKCSSCKKPIGYNSMHFICSVSTCQTSRFFPVFCSAQCWDAHVPMMNHRGSAWCEEVRSPREAPMSTRMPRSGGDSDELRARLLRQMKRDVQPAEKDVLVVASKLKKYIKERGDMSCSADVLEAVSDIIRLQANDAIDRARADGRKTVKARDFSGR